ncbi:acyl carrier protein [Ferrithrix thermotolerans DSM 19514]|uniref:Acyl carrier protein n=1 Tax=Ferrithrix thermotolerans DSM 19514 TaxID=1121881 RepID=A0A1M4VY85_9ACTN|nr:acyl carrier protein [Ferrithrix thermotolerans]SHE73938.1 acyl carrier protein [Ferrithrix thermotolerans DSM 19514]
MSELTRQEIFETIRGHLADILEIDPSKISEGSSFSEDLNADSLALIELVEAIEDEFSKGDTTFRIEDDELEDLKTMRDAVDYVVEKLGS